LRIAAGGLFTDLSCSCCTRRLNAAYRESWSSPGFIRRRGLCVASNITLLLERMSACVDDKMSRPQSRGSLVYDTRFPKFKCELVRISSTQPLPYAIYASMRTQVSKVVSNFYALRQVRRISRSVSRPVLLLLVVSFVLTRYYYGNLTLAGLPRQLLDRLQSVPNAAARVIFSARKYNHVSPLLQEVGLHWLRVPQRIEFNLPYSYRPIAVFTAWRRRTSPTASIM